MSMTKPDAPRDPLAYRAALLLGSWGPKHLLQWRTAYPDTAISEAFDELQRARKRGTEIHAPAHYVAEILRERSRRLAWLKRQVKRTARSAAALWCLLPAVGALLACGCAEEPPAHPRGRVVRVLLLQDAEIRARVLSGLDPAMASPEGAVMLLRQGTVLGIELDADVPADAPDPDPEPEPTGEIRPCVSARL